MSKMLTRLQKKQQAKKVAGNGSNTAETSSAASVAISTTQDDGASSTPPDLSVCPDGYDKKKWKKLTEMDKMKYLFQQAKAGEAQAKAELQAAVFTPIPLWEGLHEHLPLPPWGRKTYSQSTLAPDVRTPMNVVQIPRYDFTIMKEVKDIIAQLKQLEAAKAPFYTNKSWRETDMASDNEPGVDRAFAHAAEMISQFFKSNNFGDQFPFWFRGKTDQTDGQPDFSFTDSSVNIETPFVIGEYKPATCNSRSHQDLDKAHQNVSLPMDAKFEMEKDKEVSPIKQLFDYMCCNGVLFGILCSYVHVWFFIRDCKSKLVVVEAFRMDHCPQGEMSVVQAIVAFLLLAQKKEIPLTLLQQGLLVQCDKQCDHKPSVSDSTTGSSSASSSKAKPKSSKGNKKQSGAGNVTQDQAAISFPNAIQNPNKICRYLYDIETNAYGPVNREYLPGARTGTMVRIKTSGGEDVVVKKGDTYKQKQVKGELQNEARSYEKLKHLQGKVIPELKGFGHDPRSHFLYTLTTAYAGKPLSDVDALFEEEKEQALKALDAIHAAGVLHNDIKEDNIVIERSDQKKPGKVCLVDFAFATADSSGAPKVELSEGVPQQPKLEFTQAAEKERGLMIDMLNGLPTVHESEMVENMDIG